MQDVCTMTNAVQEPDSPADESVKVIKESNKGNQMYNTSNPQSFADGCARCRDRVVADLQYRMLYRSGSAPKRFL